VPPKTPTPTPKAGPDRACVVCGHWSHKRGPEPDGKLRCFAHSIREDCQATKERNAVEGKKAKQPAAKAKKPAVDRSLAALAKKLGAADIGTLEGRREARKIALQALFKGLPASSASAVESILRGQAAEAPEDGDAEAGSVELRYDLSALSAEDVADVEDPSRHDPVEEDEGPPPEPERYAVIQ
jgi:hypothetical protein